MIITVSIRDLDTALKGARAKGKKIGFVPTMGALHTGHFSLIRASQRENDITVCSIFVNPTQFNNTDDLVKYPRTLHADARALAEIDCDVLFAPEVEDIYPNGVHDTPEIDLAGLDELMEGAHRSGHFAGVVQVVKRLLDIVLPDNLYMGQKDFQQFTIIRHMIGYFDLPVRLVVCPTLRERHGLAMSSRNVRLTPTHRRDADVIYTVLLASQRWIDFMPIREIEEKAMRFMTIDGFRPEYFTIVNGVNLQPIEELSDAQEIVACTAVWAGDVRLIDNMILRENAE